MYKYSDPHADHAAWDRDHADDDSSLEARYGKYEKSLREHGSIEVSWGEHYDACDIIADNDEEFFHSYMANKFPMAYTAEDKVTLYDRMQKDFIEKALEILRKDSPDINSKYYG